jgi:hypothetical protein
MTKYEPGRLYACRWHGDEDDQDDCFRIVEIVERLGSAVTIWAYGNRFEDVPAVVDAASLRRIRLHEFHDGPLEVSLAEFATWEPVLVKTGR